MRKSVIKYYENHRSYDIADFDSMAGRRVVKRRARRRLRSQLMKEQRKELAEV